MIADGVIAVIIAYLLGSIPWAYIITRLLTGKDIRKLGGGNVGARNTFREVGLRAGIPVAILDVGKGVAAIVIAHRLLDVSLYEPQFFLKAAEPQLFLLAAGLAAVAGHMWSIYLKFSGGNGLAAAVGVLSILMPWGLLIVLGLMLILAAVTRNPILSLNISLFSLPFSAGFLGNSWLFVVFTCLLILILILNFIPTAKAALVNAGSKENLFAELLWRNKAKKKGI